MATKTKGAADSRADAIKIMENDGWSFEGPDGKEHLVFAHPEAGRVRLPSTPKHGWNTSINEARKKLKRTRSASWAFYLWLCQKYDVPDAETKVLPVKINDEIREWLDQFGQDWTHRNGTPPSHNAIQVWTSANFHRNKRTGDWTVPGRDYGFIDAAKKAEVEVKAEPVAESEPVAKPGDVVCASQFVMGDGAIAVCTLKEGHSGLCFDAMRNKRWHPDAQPQVGREPTAEELAALEPDTKVGRAVRDAVVRKDEKPAPPKLVEKLVPVQVNTPLSKPGQVGLPVEIVDAIKNALYPQVQAEMENSLAAVELAASELATLSNRLTIARDAYIDQTAEIQQAIDETITMLRSHIKDVRQVG